MPATLSVQASHDSPESVRARGNGRLRNENKRVKSGWDGDYLANGVFPARLAVQALAQVGGSFSSRIYPIFSIPSLANWSLLDSPSPRPFRVSNQLNFRPLSNRNEPISTL